MTHISFFFFISKSETCQSPYLFFFPYFHTHLSRMTYKKYLWKHFCDFFNSKMFFSGEGMWESNPPRTLLTPHTGFEDQEAHQLLIYPHISRYASRRIDNLPQFAANFNKNIFIFQPLVF